MKKISYVLLISMLISFGGCFNNKKNNSSSQSLTSISNSSSQGPSSSSTSTPVNTELPILPYEGDPSPYLDMGDAYPIPANPNLIIHYYRYNENYKGWFAWMWSSKPRGMGGRFFFQQLDVIDGKKWATLSLNIDEAISDVYTSWDTQAKGKFEFSKKLSLVGILIRDKVGNKEMEKDRLIDMMIKEVDGKVHAYVIEGESEINQQFSDFQDNFLQSAKVEQTFDCITLKTFKPFEPNSTFSLKNDDGEIAIKETIISQNGLVALMVLENNFDINNIAKNCLVSSPGYGTIALDYSNIYDTDLFIKNFTTDEDLGVFYTPSETLFKLWAPSASRVVLNFYNFGESDVSSYDKVDLVRGAKGVWSYLKNSDMKGRYYNYDVTIGKSTKKEVMDPYAYAGGINGERACIVDLNETNPVGWDSVVIPDTTASNDAVVYEMHVRDFTNDVSWNGSEANRGKYLGLIESGTTYTRQGKDYKTGFDYLTDSNEKLGINYIQLMPLADNGSVDETKINDPEFLAKEYSGIYNWGYDPQNYGFPDGVYSKDPSNPALRINELKQVSKAYNDKGIGIILDVVFNHMSSQSSTGFDLTVPNYYFRGRNDSNAGADMASERVMFRKYMVDMCTYWASEYKISGFRFDLMGLHDIGAMNAISDALKDVIQENNPDATPILYGEGWYMFGDGNSPVKDDMAVTGNVKRLHNIGAFSGEFRNAVRGGGNGMEKGWANGNNSKAGDVAYRISDNYSYKYAGNSVNYVSAHDDLTLYDKIQYSQPFATKEEVKQMANLATSIVMTSQGTAFMDSGTEMLRTKEVESSDKSDKIVTNGFKWFNPDSYNGTDAINNLKWSEMARNSDVVDVYRNLIKMRLDQGIFRANKINGVNITSSVSEDNTKIYVKITNTTAVNGKWNTVTIIYNNASTSFNYTVESGHKVGYLNNVYNASGTSNSSISIPARSIAVTFKN